MKSNNKPKDSGFTIIEMLVAVVVSSLILIGIMTFLVNTLVNNSVRQARADLLRESQLALDVMTKDIRLSANVDAENRWEDVNSPNAEESNGFGWESGDNILVLATAAEDEDNNILFQDATHYITEKNNTVFYVENGNLYKRILASDIEDNSSRTTCPSEESSEDCPADIRLVQNVKEFNLKYFNSLDEEVEPSQARSVGVSLILETTKYGRVVTTEYSTRTVFRNE